MTITDNHPTLPTQLIAGVTVSDEIGGVPRSNNGY
jgi:hypothetical protein